jgi:hypothetical protein
VSKYFFLVYNLFGMSFEGAQMLRGIGSSYRERLSRTRAPQVYHKIVTSICEFVVTRLHNIRDDGGKLVRDYKNSSTCGNGRTIFDKLIYLDS